MKRVLSGIQPTGDLHLGNYFGMMSRMIKYQEDVQGHLSLHHDSGSISCVLTLNRDFEGGGTWFWRQQKVHKGNVGEISIHPAQITHRHGGRPISKGERYIIVSFCSKP